LAASLLSGLHHPPPGNHLPAHKRNLHTFYGDLANAAVLITHTRGGHRGCTAYTGAAKRRAAPGGPGPHTPGTPRSCAAGSAAGSRGRPPVRHRYGGPTTRPRRRDPEGDRHTQGGGSLTLDASRGRLYVSPRYDEGVVTVVDADRLRVVDTLEPGGFVSLDNKRNRLYVGNRIFFTPTADTPGVRFYDAATLEQVGEIPQPGVPVYNRLRDELYIVGYSVYIADPEKGEVKGDLLPEITEQPLAWCNGCQAATHALVDPVRNLLAVEVTTLSAGKGPGMMPPPRFFDATTLKEITDPAGIPPYEYRCGDRLVLTGPVDGRVVRGERYSRYVFYNNLLVYDLAGNLLTWRDGLGPGITHPGTGQVYLPHGEDTLILDLASLSPLGALPPLCIHSLDLEAGRIYAQAGREMVVLSDRGGRPGAAAAGAKGSLPAEQVLDIQPSPQYAQDSTVFMTTPGKIYRSLDGGETWTRLRGGLPEGEPLTLDLAISPAFETDQTLFAGGFRGDFWGEGVYRSTDGGDSWAPMWADLTHLRVYDVAISPLYASDGTLLAYSRYQRLSPWQGGLSLFRSEDRGLSWTLVMTRPQDASLPPPEELLSVAAGQAHVAATEAQFRLSDYGRGVERWAQAGQAWEPTVLARLPGFFAQAILVSPRFEQDRTVYVLSEFELFRSTDGGLAWARWADARLEGRDYASKLSTATLSPPLPDGRYQLFLGTANGELWSLDPAQLEWERVQVADLWPTVLEGVWVGEIEAPPNGEVWLGTWGQGLARFQDGAIQARYAITDGLPSQYIGGISVAPDGTVWAGGDMPAGVASFDGRQWTPHPFPDEEMAVALLDLAAGPDGSVWVGGQSAGLLRWDGREWLQIEDPQGLTGWRVSGIEIDRDGTLWCATAGGLVFYSRGTWSGQGGVEGQAVALGPGGTAYYLTSAGEVYRYADGQWSALPAAREGYSWRTYGLLAASDGAVWLGSDQGAYRYDGQTWQRFTAQDGLPAHSVVAIAEDAQGWLWFGTEKGAARIDPRRLALSPATWPTAPRA
jgi:hypothetical protein